MGLRGDCSRPKLRLAQAADGKADHGRPIGHSPALVIAEVVGFKGGRSENLGQARPNMHAALRLGRRKRAPGARKEIAADSVDAVEGGHDISCTADPWSVLRSKICTRRQTSIPSPRILTATLCTGSQTTRAMSASLTIFLPSCVSGSSERAFPSSGRRFIS